MINKALSSRIILAPFFALAFHTTLLANEDTATATESNTNKTSSTKYLEAGVMPQLGITLHIPEKYQFRHPEKFSEPVEYNRIFPFMAQKAIDKGAAIPRPFGIAVIGVYNEMEQLVDDLSVALGQGFIPPADTPLTDLPFVAINNVRSETTSLQLKADVWVLPFLNIFASAGQVKGMVNLDVDIDLGAASPRPRPPFNRVVRINFDSKVDAITGTLGGTAAYGLGNWFVSGTAAATLSQGQKSETSKVESYTGDIRFGRRWLFGKSNNVIAPYFGVSYMDIDNYVTGVTTAPGEFDNGDKLYVRYQAHFDNKDKWSGVVGLSIGLKRGFGVQGEYSGNSNGQRFLLSGTYRF